MWMEGGLPTKVDASSSSLTEGHKIRELCRVRHLEPFNTVLLMDGAGRVSSTSDLPGKAGFS
jgi:hypothetical protein